MPFEITMPLLGLTMESGVIVQWLIQEGETFTAGQEILEVESDKAIVMVQAHQDGVLARIVVPAGREAPVGAPVAVAVAPGEPVPSDWKDSEPAALPGASPARPAVASAEEPPRSKPAGDSRLEASWKARSLARQMGRDLHQISGSGPGGRIVAADVLQPQVVPAPPPALDANASPVAVNLASALGLDLSRVMGSGPGGRITKPDVLAAAAVLIREAAAAPAPGPAVASTVPLKGVRKIVSEGMATSAHTAARVTLFREVDASGFVALREQLKAQGLSVSYNDMLVRICAVALQEHPAANARLGDGQIQLLGEVHIGLAVDTERGLLVPVIHHADALTLPQIAEESARLIAAAQTGRILPDDLTGGTFTITNLGMFGVEGFTPIINLPECCILGVGRIGLKPVILAGSDTVVARPMMTLSLVFDHRVIDGAPAARFLDRVAQLVQDPGSQMKVN